MKSTLFALLLVLLGVSHAQAIDCAKASTPIEHAICNSPDALKADDMMSAAYSAALKLSTPKAAKALKEDQVNWNDLRSDCQYDANGATATLAAPAAIAKCLTDGANLRTQFLTGSPTAGPGAPDPMTPMVLVGIDDIFNHYLRFAAPANAGEKAFDAALDKELKTVHTATSTSDNSDSFEMTLAYASPALISANVDFESDGAQYAHPMPSNFSINIGMAAGQRLAIADMLDKPAIATIDAACAAQLADFIAKGTEGDDIRRSDVDTMAGDLDMWTFGGAAATLRYVDYATLDTPVLCTIGYDLLKPLVKAGFSLPQ